MSQVLFGPFCTVQHIPTKSSLSIKKVPVEKESSHSKFFGQLCNSSSWWVTKCQKSSVCVREGVWLGVFSVSFDFPSPLIVFGWTPTTLQKKALYGRNTLNCRKTSKKNAKPYSRDYFHFTLYLLSQSFSMGWSELGSPLVLFFLCNLSFHVMKKWNKFSSNTFKVPRVRFLKKKLVLVEKQDWLKLVSTFQLCSIGRPGGFVM